MAGEDDLELRATLDDAVSNVLERIEGRLDRLEEKLVEVNAAGRAAGAGVEEGADNAEEALRRQERQTDSTTRSTKGLGDETEKTSKKQDKSTSRMQRLEKQLGKTSKAFGGFKWMMMSLKFSVILGGVYALASALSALGAGAITAVAGIGEMAPGLAAALPLILAVKLGMKAFELGAKAAQPQVDALKSKFDGLGNSVVKGGLGKGLSYMTGRIGPFVKVANSGFFAIGGSLRFAAEGATDFITQSSRLDQVEGLMKGSADILDRLIPGVLHLAGGFLNLLQAAMPAGRELADLFSGIAESFDNWTEAQLKSGRAQQVITNGLHLLQRAGGVVVDVLVGLFHIFAIGSTSAGSMGLSIEDAARKFRAWTTSASGQNSIQDYFTKSQPAIHETVLLIRDLLKMFGGLASSGDAAPIIAQLRTELLPVIQQLLNNFSGSQGLLPVLIHAVSVIGGLFAALDPSSLQIIVDGIGHLADGIKWLSDNVPGASSVLSALFTGALLVGPLAGVAEKVTSVVDLVGGISDGAGKAMDKLGEYKGYWDEFSENSEMIKGMKDQLMGAVGWTKGLVAEGGLLAGPWGKASTAVKTFGTFLKVQAVAGLTAVRGAALLTWDALMGPLGLIILAIIAVVAVIIYLWNNCEWFRNAVLTVWAAIKDAAVAAWNWIVAVAITAFNWIVSVATTVWSAVSGAAVAAWTWISSIVTTVVGVIATIFTWLWANVLKPVIDFFVAYYTAVWNVIKFVVQVVVYIIIGIITVMALILQGIWWLVSTVAVFVWQNVILPVIQFVVGLIITIFTALVSFFVFVWNLIVAGAVMYWQMILLPVIQFVVAVVMAIWNGIVAFFTFVWSMIVAGAMLAWQGVILPVIQFVVNMVTAIWNGVVAFFTWIWSMISAGATAAWNGTIMPIFNFVAGIAMAVWRPVAAFFSALWSGIASAAKACWDGISSAASAVGKVVSGVWDAVVGAVKGAYNAIANGWNSIPDITVPDWVPGLGGQTFGLPKLPTLWHGGTVQYDTAIVGEHGPEPLIGPGGNYMGMLGANGPEIASGLPRGGYVVPNLSTLTSMPGLLRTLPSGVARAVAGSVPGYGDMLAPKSTATAPPPRRGGDDGNAALAAAVRALAAAVADKPPPINASGDDVEDKVYAALRRWEQRKELRKRYSY